MADRIEIVDALESLAVHCRPPLMSVDDRSRWLKDWCDDLAEFDGDAVRLAITRWRQSENTKFPTPGQLLPMVRLASKRSSVQPDEGRPRAWTWPSEDELDGMTLTERRRSYLIMASQARGKAGAMGDDGTHPRPEWITRSKAYLDEAQRIAGYISRGAQKKLDAAE